MGCDAAVHEVLTTHRVFITQALYVFMIRGIGKIYLREYASTQICRDWKYSIEVGSNALQKIPNDLNWAYIIFITETRVFILRQPSYVLFYVFEGGYKNAKWQMWPSDTIY